MGEIIIGVIASIIAATLLSILTVLWKLYPKIIRKVTLQLVDKALKVGTQDTNEDQRTFKGEVIEHVLQAHKQHSSIIEFDNQEACEAQLVENFRNAKTTKILTIRGERYFLGHRSLFCDLCQQKTGKDFKIEVLLLATDASHLTDEQAKNLGHPSISEVKRKMNVVFEKHFDELSKCSTELL